MPSSEKAFDPFDELGHLLIALSEGELSAQESARLQEILLHSPQARQYFLEYLLLHAELHWAAGPGQQVERHAPALVPECPLSLDVPVPWTIPLRKLLRRWRWVLTAVGLLAAIGLGILLLRLVWKPGAIGVPSEPLSGPVARWGQTSLPQWADSSTTPQAAAELLPGQRIELQSGLAELLFDRQTRLILQGPARLQILAPRRVELLFGRLSVHVPKEEETFSVQVPLANIYGPPPSFKGPSTDFGVVIEPTGLGEVHVFAGQAEIQVRPPLQGLILRGEDMPVRSKKKEVQPEEKPSAPQRSYSLEAEQAVRIVPPGEITTPLMELVEILPDLPSFVYRLPAESWAKGLSQFRTEVGQHPALLHHYTFEGASPEEQRQDKRGQLHLVEVIMSGGRGEVPARFLLAPSGAAQWAFHPTRGFYTGNTIGAALQSEAVFHPPQALTIELLVNFAGFPLRQKDPLGTLLATRADPRRSSFFLAIGSEGRILHLFDADQAWQEAEIALIPGEWYYLASTFQTDLEKQTTTVNTYLANLTRGETTLQWVLQNKTLAGMPAPSRLGVGKGFDQDGAHAYPWPGLLDEIAIYRSALDSHTLQHHHSLLVKPETPPSVGGQSY